MLEFVMDPLKPWEDFLSTVKQNIREKLLEQVKNKFEIKSYQDKNNYLDFPELNYGNKLIEQRKWQLAELFWRAILEETRSFKEEYPDHHINVGLPLANLGIALIGQGKSLDGVIFLYNAYDDDKETRDKYNLGSTHSLDELINSILYKQFESTIITNLSSTGQVNHVTLRGYIDRLSAEKRVQMFYILAELMDSIKKAKHIKTSPQILNPKLTSIFLQLTMFWESELKRVHGEKGMLFNLMECALQVKGLVKTLEKGSLKGKDDPKNLIEFNEALELLNKQLLTRPEIEVKCLAVRLIRSYYTHNITDIETSIFLNNYEKYCYWLLETILLL